MNHTRRYERLLELLHLYPQFNSIEDGMAYETIQPGEVRRFIVRGRLGSYQFHRCYWQRDLLVSVLDWSTSAGELWRLRQLAALEIGNSVLNQ